MVEQGGRIAILSSEGGLFETMAGRYANGVINIDIFLKGYSQDPVRVDRRSRPSENIDKPTVTLLITVQPEVVNDLKKKKGFRGRGLLARFLYSVPRSLVGYRSTDPPDMPSGLQEEWDGVILKILELPDVNVPDTQELTFSPRALELFQIFRDQVEIRLRPGEEWGDIADWGNKLAGNTARLAGILHLLEHVDASKPWEITISPKTMEGAIELGWYFAAHAEYAFEMMEGMAAGGILEKVWNVIEKKKWEKFSVRDLYQIVKRQFSDVTELERVLARLTDLWYIQPVHTDHSGPGRPPSQIFVVNPEKRPQNPQNPSGRS